MGRGSRREHDASAAAGELRLRRRSGPGAPGWLADGDRPAPRPAPSLAEPWDDDIIVTELLDGELMDGWAHHQARDLTKRLMRRYDPNVMRRLERRLAVTGLAQDAATLRLHRIVGSHDITGILNTCRRPDLIESAAKTITRPGLLDDEHLTDLIGPPVGDRNAQARVRAHLDPARVFGAPDLEGRLIDEWAQVLREDALHARPGTITAAEERERTLNWAKTVADRYEAACNTELSPISARIADKLFDSKAPRHWRKAREVIVDAAAEYAETVTPGVNDSLRSRRALRKQLRSATLDAQQVRLAIVSDGAPLEQILGGELYDAR